MYPSDESKKVVRFLSRVLSGHLCADVRSALACNVPGPTRAVLFSRPVLRNFGNLRS